LTTAADGELSRWLPLEHLATDVHGCCELGIPLTVHHSGSVDHVASSAAVDSQVMGIRSRGMLHAGRNRQLTLLPGSKTARADS
jgi:hypothetical protein